MDTARARPYNRTCALQKVDIPPVVRPTRVPIYCGAVAPQKWRSTNTITLLSLAHRIHIGTNKTAVCLNSQIYI